MFYARNGESRNIPTTMQEQELEPNVLIPNVLIPSPESPLVLPGEPNPFNKPGLIPVFQYISNIYQQYLKDQVNVGYLQVQVSTDNGAKPVKNAKITISKPIGNDIFMSQILFTDEQGKTKIVPLPTRSAELSQTSEYPVPYTIWNLTAEAPGYYDIIIYDVPIFPSVTTKQSFDFVPINGNSRGTTEEIYASERKANPYY